MDATNPDMAKRDYRLKPEAAAKLGKGAPVPPYGGCAYLGAYAYGGPKWEAGAKRPAPKAVAAPAAKNAR